MSRSRTNSYRRENSPPSWSSDDSDDSYESSSLSEGSSSDENDDSLEKRNNHSAAKSSSSVERRGSDEIDDSHEKGNNHSASESSSYDERHGSDKIDDSHEKRNSSSAPGNSSSAPGNSSSANEASSPDEILDSHSSLESVSPRKEKHVSDEKDGSDETASASAVQNRRPCIPDISYSSSDEDMPTLGMLLSGGKKLRIRGLNAHLVSEDCIDIAVNVLNNWLNAYLTTEDICDCTVKESWLENGDTDLVVEFNECETRDRVYRLRTKENEGLIYLCDDLGEEAIEIWKELNRDFGEKKLCTVYGRVVLHHGEKDEIEFAEYRDLRSFYKKRKRSRK